MKIFLVLLAVIAGNAEARIHRIPRSHAAIHAFVKQHECPSTHRHRLPCPGHVIDHKRALVCGGADAPYNMQWQTIAEGKARDKWELKECGK